MKKISLIIAIILGLSASVYANEEAKIVNTMPVESEEFRLDNPVQISPIDVKPIKSESLSQERLEEEIKKMDLFKRVNISYNGEKINYDVSPQYIDGKFMVPLRHTLEVMDYEVNWNQEEQSIEIIKGVKYTKLYIGKNNYSKNKMAPISLSKAPIILNGRTLIPMEFFHEILSLNFDVKENNIEFIGERGEKGIDSLTTHSGILRKAEREDGVVKYHISGEESEEVSMIITLKDNASFYQKIPKIGGTINIVSSSLMLMSYPGQTGGFIIY